MTFEDFDFAPALLDGLDAMGFTKPTPIQVQAIPMILDGDDLIACAQTGTGKTGAYLLPILNNIYENDPPDGVKCLIIAPTRELAMQIDQQVEGMGYFVDVNSIAVYGGGKGDAFEQQKTALTKGADIIIATPGRLIAHLNMNYVSLDKVKYLILDEADRMLDMGFHEDIEKIINFLPKERQNLLFSATMPPKIRELANKILVNPKHINISLSKPAEGVLQGAYLVHSPQKNRLIEHLLKGKEATYPSVIIFSSTKRVVSELTRLMKAKGYSVGEMSSDLEQAQREACLREFKSRRLQIIVATDVMARGIDIKEISLVINYDVPGDAEDYVHRVGRTARADSTGVALTFINEEDVYKFKKIEELIGSTVQKLELPDGFHKDIDYSAPSKRPEYKPRTGSGKPRTGGAPHGKGGGQKRSGYQGKKK